MKALKTLTDKQYENLQDIASQNGITLNGYTVTWNIITLYNSRRSGVAWKNMQELIDELNKINYYKQ